VTGPRPRMVADASALVALLVDDGPAGDWATGHLAGADLVAPQIAPFEVANILRRHELAGILRADQAAAAHADLLDLTVELWPYELLARRAWELRANLTVYDAAYVAVAERVGATLVTLDRRIAGSPGVGCPIAAPAADRSEGD
jgi:predicted nucleic acid-binding protein